MDLFSSPLDHQILDRQRFTVYIEPYFRIVQFQVALSNDTRRLTGGHLLKTAIGQQYVHPYVQGG